MTEKQQAQPEQQAQAQTAAPAVQQQAQSSLPAQLKEFSWCFSASKKTFLATFEDQAQGERIFSKEVNFAAQAMMNNSYLITCAKNNPNALIDSIKNVALTGLSLNPVLKLGYLVPFKGTITFMASYMGLVDILVNNGIAKKAEAHAVFRGDTFEIQHGSNGYIKHRPDPWGNRTQETFCGCYYYILLADGTELFDTLNKEEIELVKKRSASVSSGKSSPWDSDYLEMAKKTAIRRGFKACPKSNISESKLKTIEAMLDFDSKVEQEWVKEQNKPKDDNFDEDAEVDYVEVQ
jgi:recombination protein RecT